MLAIWVFRAFMVNKLPAKYRIMMLIIVGWLTALCVSDLDLFLSGLWETLEIELVYFTA